METPLAVVVVAMVPLQHRSATSRMTEVRALPVLQELRMAVAEEDLVAVGAVEVWGPVVQAAMRVPGVGLQVERQGTTQLG